MPRMIKMSSSILIVVAIMTLASGFMDVRSRAYPARSYQEFIPKVVDGTADAPERYRVLAPFAVYGLERVTGLSASAAWYVSRLAAFFTAYLVFFAYLRTWFTSPQALLGTAMVAATLPLTFTNSWAHPDHIPELALFTAGCLAIARERLAWVFILLALATLNRETAVFLIPLYLLAGTMTRARLVVTAVLAAEWAAIYFGLRFWRGFVHYDYLQLTRNLDFLKLLPDNYDPYYRAYAWFGLALFGGLLTVGLRTQGSPPLFVTRALWVTPLFGAVAFAISSIIESRIFTPLYPLVMPAVIFALGSTDNLTSPVKS